MRKGSRSPTPTVRLEFEKDGLKDETATNSKGEWSFIGLGTGNVNLSRFG